MLVKVPCVPGMCTLRLSAALLCRYHPGQNLDYHLPSVPVVPAPDLPAGKPLALPPGLGQWVKVCSWGKEQRDGGTILVKVC